MVSLSIVVTFSQSYANIIHKSTRQSYLHSSGYYEKLIGYTLFQLSTLDFLLTIISTNYH